MDETQLLPCTQALLGGCDDGEKDTFGNGWLELAGERHDLVLGENKIGRDPDTCQVLLLNAVGVSKEHALLEVEDGCATLMDLASRNKTRMGKLVLRPHIRYALCGGERLLFGNVSAMYMINKDSSESGAANEDHQVLRDRDVKLCSSSELIPSLASTPSVSLSPDLTESPGSCNAPLQGNECPKVNHSESNIIEDHASDQESKLSSPKKTDSSPDKSDAHSTTSKANTSFEMLTTDNFPPNTPVLELKRSNSCSPFRKGTQDRKYARKCFFMPTQSKTVVEESDEEAHSDDNREEDDFDDSIISPTPQPRCSSLLGRPAASSSLTTPALSLKLQDKLATIPETPCTPLSRGRAATGSPSTSVVPDSQSTPGPGHSSAAVNKKPQGNIGATSNCFTDSNAECYNSDASTDVENEIEVEEDAAVEQNKDNSSKTITERRLLVRGISKNANITNEDGTPGDFREELTQVLSEKTCPAPENDDLSFVDDAPTATQDILEAFGETATESSEMSLNLADETQDILSALDESTLSPRKISGDVFKKPFSTPVTGKKSAINLQERSLNDSALTQDVLDVFECPTRVVTGRLPRPNLENSTEQDDLSLAPTQLYTCNEQDVTEEPTQIIVPEDYQTPDDDSISDMCTQIYNEDTAQKASQRPGLMTPVTRRVVEKTTPDDFKSPSKAPIPTDMESPSCLPTQIYNENLHSPHVLSESISDMATQPYHSDFNENVNDSPRPCADLNAELSMSEMATQPYVADHADGAQRETEFSSNFSKPWCVDVDKENDTISEMATQPYFTDQHSKTSKPELTICCFSVKPQSVDSCTCPGDNLSDVATQPYFGPATINNLSEIKNKQKMSTQKELSADVEESISNMPTQPYVDGNVDEPADVDATQVFDFSESGGSSKTVIEVKNDNLALENEYDAPTQDMLNGEDAASPSLVGKEDYDAPTHIISNNEQDQDSTGIVTDPSEVSLPGEAHSSLTSVVDDKEQNTGQTPLKLPEKNDDIELTPSLNPVAQNANANNISVNLQSADHGEFNEDQDTDSCHSSVVSDTMLVNMPEDIDEGECRSYNFEGTSINKSASLQPEIRTSASRSSTPTHDVGNSMPDVLATDSTTPTPDSVSGSRTLAPDAGSTSITPTADVASDSITPALDAASDSITPPPDAASNSITPPPDAASDSIGPAPDTKSSPSGVPIAERGDDISENEFPVNTHLPATKTSSPAAKTRSCNVDAPQESETNSAENLTNCFQFGSNQYNVGNLDIDDNASDESVETLNFVSDTESGCQVFTPVKDVALQAASTSGSSAESPFIDVKTPYKISANESVLPRSKRSPRQSTLRKKKKYSEKSKDLVNSSDDDSELDASSQALFSMSMNITTAFKSSDCYSHGASTSDHSSPLIPVSKTHGSAAVRDTKDKVEELSLVTADNTAGITTKPHCSSVPSDGIGAASIQDRHCGLSISSAIPVSSDSDNEPLKDINFRKSTKTARGASRVSKRKCPDSNIERGVKSLRNEMQLTDEMSGVAAEGITAESCVSGNRASTRGRLERTNAGPSKSSGFIELSKASKNLVGESLTHEISSTSTRKQADDHGNSIQVRSTTKDEKVTGTSVRSTRSARARRPPVRYSPDQKDSNGNDEVDSNRVVGQENYQKTLSTTTAQKRNRFSKGPAKRVKDSNEVGSLFDKKANTNDSLSTRDAREESGETNSLAENPCSSSDVPSSLIPESVSSNSKPERACKSHSSAKGSTRSEAKVDIKVDSESTISSTTDTLIENGGRGSRPKNRASIETSTPSKSLLPTRNTRSRASLAAASSQVKPRPRRGNAASPLSGTSSAADGFSGGSLQSVTSSSYLPVLSEEEAEITFNISELHRKSNRVSSRNPSLNSDLKRATVVEDDASAQEVEVPSTGTKRMKMEEPSLSSQLVDQSTASESSTSTFAIGGSRRSNRKILDSRSTVHSQNTQETASASTSKKKNCEVKPSDITENSQSSLFSVPVLTTAKRGLRKSHNSRTNQPSQDSLPSSNASVSEVAEENTNSRRRTRVDADENQSSSKPKRARGRPRNSLVQKPPETEPEDLNCSVESVESFTSSVGRRHQSGPSSQHSSTASDSARGLSDSLHLVNSLLLSPSERQSRANTKPRVLFTGIVPEADDLRTLKKLGGVVVESATQCSVLVSASAKRTCKLLACVARGVPVVTPVWLAASAAAAAFTDPWEYIVKDTEMENRHGFDLRKSLLKARGRRLLAGLSIYATPKVLPRPDDMRDLVICGGGEYLERPPRSFYDSVVVMSCEQDKKLWPAFRKLNIPVVSTEFILSGILRAEVSVDGNLLQ